MPIGGYRFRRSFGNVNSRFRGARPDTYPLFTGILDDYPSAAAAYSLRALSSAWLAGDVVEVRRSSDSATQSFTANQITNGDLVAFCGVGDGFVSTWYDQSGNGNDATQATTTAQPKIVSAGSLVTGGIDFDGVDDGLESLQNIGITGASARSIFTSITPDSNLANKSILLFGADSSGLLFSFTSEYAIRVNGGNEVYQVSNTNLSLATSIFPSSSSDVVDNNVFLNGVNLSSTSSSSIAINTTDSTLKIGLQVGGLLHYDGKLNELIIYNSDESASRLAIEANINDYYSIY